MSADPVAPDVVGPPADPGCPDTARPGPEPARRARWWRRPVPIAVAAVLAAATTGVVAIDLVGRHDPAGIPRAEGVVDIAWDTPVNTFDGTAALGAGVRGLDRGEIDKVWTLDNVDAMRSTGFGSIGMRLRTERAGQAWHWNAQGTWSDPANQQGYWTSATEVAETTGDPGATYGYDLPRRGNTLDPADNDAYSRVDDGDPATFWKSNPYLDARFTGEPDANHPQWIVAAFPQPVPVDQVRIDWGTPFATRFQVQYWTGADALHPDGDGPGGWTDFPTGAQAGRGGTQTVRVAPRPVPVRFVRILLTADSDTAPPGATDIRDRLGYAVRELAIGHTDGGFVDHVTHGPSPGQTTIVTSSTDPWHRAVDIDPDVEYPSLDRVFTSGLGANLVAVPALYGTPEDAAALATYLHAGNRAVRRVEVGSEPNGQLAQPEDYAALYLQTVAAMKAADPALEFGGPGYRTALPDWFAWPDARGVRSWTGRFVDYLRGRGRLDDFDFFSFQWYPFEDVCADPADGLARHPDLLAGLLRRQAEAGLPADLPTVVTEYGYSTVVGQPQMEMPGAIVQAETAAALLALGGDASYVYGLEPDHVLQAAAGRPCDSWGNLMLFQYGEDKDLRPLATYQVAHMLTQQWVQPGTGRHTVYAASCNLRTAAGLPLVTAYAVRRPDGRLAVLLLNKDPRRPVTVRLARTSGGTQRPVPGPLTLYQYSPLQWNWVTRPDGEAYPDRALPPYRSTVDEGRAVMLPPYSVTVVRTAGKPRQ